MKRYNIFIALLEILISINLSCSREGFLNARPDQSEVVPSKLGDFQAMLDNNNAMNGAGSGLVPALGDIGCDNYYALEEYYNVVLSASDRNMYTWNKNPYPGESLMDWDYSYLSVLYSNIVLEGVAKIGVTDENRAEHDNIVGSALFYRAHAFYQLAQVFGKPYDSVTADVDLGIPIRLSSDIIQSNKRASVKQTYVQIISDLKKSALLLPDLPVNKNRPSKAASYGLLARAYQTMERYDLAYLYADSCLELYDRLFDYNSIDSTSTSPFRDVDDEVIFNCGISDTHVIYRPGYYRIDSILYASYNSNDLRKVDFFRLSSGLPRYKGSYFHPFGKMFGGIATDEIYLIKAECAARLGLTQIAVDNLNKLLVTRWRSGTYVPFSTNDPEYALREVLVERRKELIIRGLRWTDLRRLNQDPRFKKTLTRDIFGQKYTLPPNDSRYTWPIPDDVMGFNPSMQQNP